MVDLAMAFPHELDQRAAEPSRGRAKVKKSAATAACRNRCNLVTRGRKPRGGTSGLIDPVRGYRSNRPIEWALSVPPSAISWSGASFMAMRGYFLATTALVSFGVVWHVIPGNAADMSTRFARPVASDPAVSAVNFKIDGFGGWMDATGGIPERNRDGGLGGSSASLTVPFGERYGLQLDGTGGSWGGNAFWSAGGHLFWRDPNYALLGVTGSLTRLDRGPWPFFGRGSGIDAGNFGGEGEYYMASTTLRGIAGWEGGDVPSRFFSKADLRWYPIMDLMLSVGYRFTGDRSALALSGEWLTPTSVFGGRASLFTEARVGESDFRAIVGGLRVYFGPSKTL